MATNSFGSIFVVIRMLNRLTEFVSERRIGHPVTDELVNRVALLRPIP